MNGKISALFSLLLLLCVFPGLFAEGNLLLWEARHPEREGKLFLAGSIHLGRKELFPLDKAYDSALAQSQELVFETFEEDVRASEEKITEFIRRKALYPSGKSLRDVMNESELTLLESFYRARSGVNFRREELFSRRPWILVLELTILAAAESGLKLEYGFETVFRKYRNGRPARGLEQTYTQLSMLEGTDEKQLCAVILDGIRDYAGEKKALEEILEAFRTGETAPLAAQAEKMEKKYPLFHKRVLLLRNRNMAESLAEYAKEKKTFFVLIGAAHFAGKGNILRLLEEKGFLVKQLERTGERGAIAAETANE
ncbi:MAG: TraB/GumN family protein [Lentisphaeria bacterium]|nr:TraB/GumN family protein [Lentisphaeria bacterium]